MRSVQWVRWFAELVVSLGLAFPAMGNPAATPSAIPLVQGDANGPAHPALERAYTQDAPFEPLLGRDGGWYQIPPPVMDRPLMVLDSNRDRLIALDATGAVWTFALDGDPKWEPLLPLGRLPLDYARAAFFDPARDRVLIAMTGWPTEGGLKPIPIGIWELVLAPLPFWRQLKIAGEAPVPRIEATFVYDAEQNGLLLFGGSEGPGCDYEGQNCFSQFLADAWSLTLGEQPTWQKIEVDIGEHWSALARVRAHGVWDAQRQRLFVVGGRGWGLHRDEDKADVWMLELRNPPRWTRIEAQGMAPPPGGSQAVVHDRTNDRLLVLSREGASLVTRVLSLGDTPIWTQLQVSGSAPPAREVPGAVFDERRDRVAVYGGVGHGNEMWFLEFAGGPHWRPWIPDVSFNRGIQRWFGGATYDTDQHRMLLFGGYFGEVTTDLSDVRQLPLDPLGVWQTLPTTGTGPPFNLAQPKLAYDSRRRRMLVAGDRSENGAVWALSMTEPRAWTRLIASGGPGPRLGCSATYDPVRDRLLVFGGNEGEGFAGPFRSDLWALSLDGPPRWDLLLPDLAGPPGLADHVAVYDPSDDRLLVYGGGQGFSYFSGDIWEVSLAGVPKWRLIEPSGVRPPGRQGHTAVLDVEGERLLVFSGISKDNAVWEFGLRNDQWRQLDLSGPLPARREHHSAAFDPIGRRMIIVGGSAGYGGTGRTWILDLSQRAVNARIDVLPGSLRNPVAPGTRGRLPVTVFGSAQMPVSSLELSSLTLVAAPVSTLPHDRLHARMEHADNDGIMDLLLHFDREALALNSADAVLHLTGYLANGIPVSGSDRVLVQPAVRQSYSVETQLGSEQAGSHGFALTVASSQAADIEVTFAVPAAGHGVLELFDLSGRRVVSLDVGPTEAGGSRVQLARYGVLQSGIYFVRLVHVSGSLVKRVAVLH
jgi:hypothetical protein